MSQSADLAALLAKHRPETALLAPKVARALVRRAKLLHRSYVNACNRPLLLKEQADEIRHERAVKRLCDTVRIEVKFNGDPRGFPVKLHFGGENQPHNTWGGTGDGWGIG